MISRVHPVADDYSWFDERFPALAEAYCITLVSGLPPEEVLRRFGATEQAPIAGVADLVAAAFAAWDRSDGFQLFLAATAVGDWTLMVEPNGFLGITESAVVPLSRGRRVVSHFRNVNAVDHFYWIEDGTVRLTFEPLFAHRRDGSDPDALVDVMEQVGFDVRSGGPDGHTAAAFALAEYLTGVRLTPQLLESPFVGGTAPVPRG
jgi:Family of unknown function (DUF6461)